MFHAARLIGRSEAAKSARARRRPWQWSGRAVLFAGIAMAYLPIHAGGRMWPALVGAPVAALSTARTRWQISRRLRDGLRRMLQAPAEEPSRPSSGQAVTLWITTTDQGVMVCYDPTGGRWEPVARAAEMSVPASAGAGVPAGGSPRGSYAHRSQHCILFAVDVARFTDAKRDDEVQLAVREALYRALIDAFETSGIPWNACEHEDRGDGVVVVIPAQMPTATIVGPLVDTLAARLRRHNRLSSPAAQIRLRVAVHIGEVHWDRRGLVGTAVNDLFRMLDAAVLRQALRTTKEELSLLVSDYLYQSVIRGGPGPVAPTAFQAVMVEVKQFRARAWLRTVA